MVLEPEVGPKGAPPLKMRDNDVEKYITDHGESIQKTDINVQGMNPQENRMTNVLMLLAQHRLHDSIRVRQIYTTVGLHIAKRVKRLKKVFFSLRCGFL